MPRPPAAAILVSLLIASNAAADLIALYRFDEPAGNTAADAVSGNTATWVPGSDATPDWKPTGGLLGGAIEFPGRGTHQNYFATAPFPSFNGTPAGMTIAVWVKPAGDSGYRGILMTRTVTDDIPGDGSRSGQNYGLGHDDDHLDGRISGSPVDSPDGTLSEGDAWVHVAWVWDNTRGTQALYIDGVQSGPVQTSSNHPPGIRIISNGEWRIGDDACCSNRNFDGLMDDLAVWDEPLPASRIAALHANGLAGFGADENPPPPVTEPLDVGLVINEVHYDPEPKTQRTGFVELLNTGPGPLDLSGYHFTNGISFTVPDGTTLGVTEYLVISENPAEPLHFTGSLSNDGERLTLVDADGNTVDTVDYRNRFPWPIAANGEGDSMQLVNATLDNDLGASWRPATPTPGVQNATFADNAPPQLRQVDHSPEQPTATESTTVTVKATDPDTVAAVTLQVQIVEPGAFVPAFLPLSSSDLRNNPSRPLTPNPAFAENWTDIPMAGDAGGRYTATVPPQPHRTLVRYRITASDALGNSVTAPFADDPSLNFAYFSYDGVPDYVADDGTVFPSGILTSLPTYHLITHPDHFTQCWAYDPADRAGGTASRKKFNWEGAIVYEGVVYDHVKYRLRQRNDRYAGQGRRPMRFRFLRGNYLQARDPDGNKVEHRWRSMNTSKMTRFSSGSNIGLRELVSSRLWNLAGVVAPEFQHIHFRVVDAADEAPDQYRGDFHGLSLAFEDVDAQFVKNRDLPRGNIYKLKDGESSPFELQRYQARDAVTDASDFINIRDNLGPPERSDDWLRRHVDWNAWYLYAALGEGFRHYDFSPYFRKNRIWYFRPDPAAPLGLMRVIPHDTDGTWRRGTNDSMWDDPTWGPSEGFRGRVVGVDLPKEAIQEVTGLDGTDGENHPERPDFMRGYRNVIREVSDLFWNPETVNAVIDAAAQNIAPFHPADRVRWTGGPPDVGSESIGTLAAEVAQLKSLAFEEDLYRGRSLDGGRATWLRQLADDPSIPSTPTIASTDFRTFSTDTSNPPAQQWRIAQLPAPTHHIESGHTWHYHDLGTDPGNGWNNTGFDDSTWPSGPTQIGYGETDQQTTTTNRPTTTYFRTTITVDNPDAIAAFHAGIIRDDGAAVYVNGLEVLRTNLPDGPLTPDTVASRSASGSDETDPLPFIISPAYFRPGANVIAVEVHQRPANSGDMSFDFTLRSDPASGPFEWHPTWTSESTASSVTAPAVATRPGLVYRARVRQQGADGAWSHWSDPLEFTAPENDLTPYTDALVVSEIMADPPGGPNYEFVEIHNTGDAPLDLEGVRFTKGIDFDFSGTLEPGAFLLAVRDLAAFTERYGPGLPVAGQYSGKLDNAGERLKLSFGAGEPIRDFDFDFGGEWPDSPGLTLVAPTTVPDHASPLSWRPSADPLGSPGTSDAVPYTGGDPLAYALASPHVTLSPDTPFALTFVQNLLAEDATLHLELSHDLVTWTRPPAARTPTTLALTDPTTTRPLYLRLAVEIGGR